MSDIYLHYIGKDKGTIPGVPARDLTYDEAKQHDLTHLIASGLYVYVPNIPAEYKEDLNVTEPPKRTRRTKKEATNE